MKSIVLTLLLLVSPIGIAKEIDVPAGQFQRINLGQAQQGLSPIRCDFKIIEEHRDSKWGPVITLGLSDAADNEFIQIVFTTTKKDKYYVFKTKNGSVKFGDIESNFLSLPVAYGPQVSLYIVPWDKNGGTFDYRAQVGETIKAAGYIINPSLRTELSYSLTFSSVRADYECSFL